MGKKELRRGSKNLPKGKKGGEEGVQAKTNTEFQSREKAKKRQKR